MSDKKFLSAARFVAGAVHAAADDGKKKKNGDKTSQQTPGMSSDDIKELAPVALSAFQKLVGTKTKNGDKNAQRAFSMSSDNMKEVAPVLIHAIAEYADGKAKKGDQTAKRGPGTSSDDATESISSPVAATPSRAGAKDGDKTTERSGTKLIAKMLKESIKFAPKVVDILVEQQKKASQEVSRKA
ncbi:hypothetical protein X797_001537 [Metarhizium robertsii]|uniref:Uncharacterized protein n=2 Tax=Metarhizium robertsii TaxID=568076 RepID=E9F1F2_METRA|nr:uncharacterized protein MAA_06101 [Metarhizium robertsii ARSEF 23]EFY98962.1 hypothetical protein MAA_06101 [Metarhizium robertsii ARSEF 23]EXV03868.1 hypothetical protein X797_001537 [Metarhizium robertsii]